MSAQPKPPAPAQATAESIDALLVGRRVIRYRPEFAQLGGSGNAGVLLSQLLFWQPHATLPGGWIWKSAREWQEETGLTRREQQTAIKRLVERKLVETHRRSRRAPLYYRVNVVELRAQLEQLITPPRPHLVVTSAAGDTTADALAGTTSMAHRGDSVCTLGATPDAPIRYTSETTRPETTIPENTHTPPRARARDPEAAAPRVGVSQSKFSFEERQRYAANNRDRAGVLLGPGWLKTSANGSSDELIADWFARACPPAGAASQRDVSACPDCHGNAMWYPNGYEGKGVAKCYHPRLATAQATTKVDRSMAAVAQVVAGAQVRAADGDRLRGSSDNYDPWVGEFAKVAGEPANGER